MIFSQDHQTNKETIFHSRGFLPHYEVPEEAQMITYHLSDSLPREALVKLSEELNVVGPDKMDKTRRRMLEKYLDRGMGKCFLANESIARMAEQNLLYFDRKRYYLHAWVIMPNHVHVLITPKRDESLARIVHSWKSYTASRANAILGSKGDFWQREYFDRKIRDQRHFKKAIEYIHNNPLKAGLCDSPSEWLFGSARFL